MIKRWKQRKVWNPITFSAKNCSSSYLNAWRVRIFCAPKRTELHLIRLQPYNGTIEIRFFSLVAIVHIWCLQKLPHQSKHEQLLRIEWEIRRKIGRENGCHRINFLEPNCQQTKNSRTADGSKKAAPIVAHGKVRCCYFDTEQDTCEAMVLFSSLNRLANHKWTGQDLPPTGAAKQDATPTAHAAANISQCRDSFS